MDKFRSLLLFTALILISVTTNSQNLIGANSAFINEYMKENFKNTLTRSTQKADTLFFYLPDRTYSYFMTPDDVCYCFATAYTDVKVYEVFKIMLKEKFEYQPEIKIKIPDALETVCFIEKIKNYNYHNRYFVIKYLDAFMIVTTRVENE